MSGLTTINGAQLESQFIAAAGSSQAVSFSQIFASGVAFSMLPQNGTSNATGAVVIGPTTTNGTITGASYVISDAPDAALTVSSASAQVFATSGDTVTASSADTLFGGGSVQGGAVTSFISTGTGSSILGSTGNIAATASGANTTLIGGTGNSGFTVAGAGSLAVGGYAGSTAIALAETTGGAEIATNPLPGATATLVATLSSNGADSVIGGGGSATITGGGGNDVFGFVNGHAGGSEVIIGFTSSDTFAFGGYGYSATNGPTESYDTPGATGSDVITLTDGTTIALVGIDHKVF
jgi:hypothetical protein